MTTRRWFIVAVTCLLVAVGAPVAWWATRPAASAGPGVVAVARPSVTTRAPSLGSADVSVPGSPAPRPTTLAARPATAPAVAAVPGPGRLVIPGLDVDAVVVAVGVRPDGSAAMAIPDDVSQVGWYRFGPRPGDGAGAVVLAGHVDGAGQGRGAMYRVRELGPGDPIQVSLADGRSVGYRVIAKETIVKKRLPVERLFARDGPPRLVLITCGGPFVKSLSSYRDNVVVIAEPGMS